MLSSNGKPLKAIGLNKALDMMRQPHTPEPEGDAQDTLGIQAHRILRSMTAETRQRFWVGVDLLYSTEIKRALAAFPEKLAAAQEEWWAAAQEKWSAELMRTQPIANADDPEASAEIMKAKFAEIDRGAA